MAEVGKGNGVNLLLAGAWLERLAPRGAFRHPGWESAFDNRHHAVALAVLFGGSHGQHGCEMVGACGGLMSFKETSRTWATPSIWEEGSAVGGVTAFLIVQQLYTRILSSSRTMWEEDRQKPRVKRRTWDV